MGTCSSKVSDAPAVEKGGEQAGAVVGAPGTNMSYRQCLTVLVIAFYRFVVRDPEIRSETVASPPRP